MGQSTPLKSMVEKRSIVIGGHKTSVSLEEPFWTALKEIARRDRKNLGELVGQIDQGRTGRANLSSSIRLFVLDYYKRQGSDAPSQSDPQWAGAARVQSP